MAVSVIILLCTEFLSGIGVFLIGVRLLTTNAEALATARMEALFARAADRKLRNAVIGMTATALLQSSGVTTVLIVGFVNTGIMSLAEATAMIMGANIGTTVTAQIAALSAFPVGSYLQALAFIGILTAMLTKRERRRAYGMLIAALGLVFIGLSLMAETMSAVSDDAAFLFTQVNNPFLLFLIGALFTALVQSSSATTSIVISMAVAGISVGNGGNGFYYIILGTNVGACMTALLATVGTGLNARRAAWVHLLFNAAGAFLFFILLALFPAFTEFLSRLFPEAATRIAVFHTFFNVLSTLLFLPVSDLFVRAATWILPDPKPSPVREN